MVFMPINRSELKQKSRMIMARAVPRPMIVAVIVTALSLLIGILSNQLTVSNISTSEAQKYLQYIINGYYEGAANLLIENIPSPGAQAINLMLDIVMKIVSVGFIIFVMNTIRRTGAVVGNLLDGFGIFIRIIILELLSGIFILLWSLLLIVPGIIASYRYRLAVYLLIDHPEWSPMECIRESKRLMAGHKWELFVLDLSFIGWSILESLNFIGYFVMIYTLPYKQFSYALYYETLIDGPGIHDGGYTDSNGTQYTVL